jgi:4-amino-4-deoxy-L-arabinose transferase-like glycosyltransferase
MRVVATYPVFSHTWDESYHIAAGLQWLHDGWQDGVFTPLHPPLAQSMLALGPFALGLEYVPYESGSDFSLRAAGIQALFSGSSFWVNLSAARAGNLPFLLIALAATAVWGWRVGGWSAAVLSVFALSLLPFMLGHAGVATLDVGCAATVTTALLAFVWLLGHPVLWRAMVFGAAAGLAFLTKASAIPFLVAGCGLIFLAYLLDRRRQKQRNTNSEYSAERPGWVGMASGACVAAFFVVWFGYGFHVVHFDSDRRPHEDIDALVGEHGFLHDAAYQVIESVPVPMPDALRVIRSMFLKVERGQLSYFRGELASHGSPLFFPFLMVVKLPLAFIALLLISTILLFRDYALNSDWRSLQCIFALLGAVGVLSVGMASGVTNGFRQVLPMLPLLSVVVGYGAARLLAQRGPLRPIARLGTAGLFLWLTLVSVLAHPNYLAWFNSLAGEHPEDIVVDSDLDWGQDLARLGPALKEVGAEHVWLRYNGTRETPFEEFGLPAFDILPPNTPVTGWVALSIYSKKMPIGKGEPDTAFTWLDAHEPVRRVGSSILLYKISQEQQ